MIVSDYFIGTLSNCKIALNGYNKAPYKSNVITILNGSGFCET